MDGLFGTEIWNDTALPVSTMVARLLIAAGLGAVLGFERELRDRAAGLRTHILISVASATFAIIMIELYVGASASEGANVDPIRITEAVTAGVAFLAAGAIFRRDGGDVHGVTTGAGMWTAGAIGLAAGIGYLALATALTAISVLVLSALLWIEKRLSGS